MGLLDNPKDEAMLQFGLGLLQAGGPSRTPISLGQAIGSSGQDAMQVYRQAQQDQIARKMKGMQMEEMQSQLDAQKRQAGFLDQAAQQITDPQERAFAQAFPKEWAHAKFASQKAMEPKLVTVMTEKGPMQRWVMPGQGNGVDVGPAVDKPNHQNQPVAYVGPGGQAVWGTLEDARGKPAANFNPFVQGNVAQAKESGKTYGEETTKAQLDLPRVIANGERSIKQIDELLAHPGFKQAVGTSSVLGVQKIPGTQAYDFMNRLDQIKGGAFLEAFNTLRGAGQITEVEGKKATDALARMNNATSEPEFVAAANEFKSVINSGIERAKIKANGGQKKQKTIVRQGTYNGKRVVQYDDGSIENAD